MTCIDRIETLWCCIARSLQDHPKGRFVLFTVQDILKLLEQLPIWRSLRAMPERLDALEKRVAALEEELHRRPAPENCPLCRSEMKLQLIETHWTGNVEFHEFACTSPGCGHKRQRKLRLDKD